MRYTYHFLCLSAGWSTVGFDEFAVHQGKKGRKLRSVVNFSPSFPKCLASIDRLPIIPREKEQISATG